MTLVAKGGILYVMYMSKKASITEARRTLRALVQAAQQGIPTDITNRGEVVARIVKPANDAGGTAEALLRIRAALKKPVGRRGRIHVSSRKSVALTSRDPG